MVAGTGTLAARRTPNAPSIHKTSPCTSTPCLCPRAQAHNETFGPGDKGTLGHPPAGGTQATSRAQSTSKTIVVSLLTL